MTALSQSPSLAGRKSSRRHWSYALMSNGAYKTIASVFSRNPVLATACLLGVPVVWVIFWNVLPLIQMGHISLMRQYPLPPGELPEYTLDNFRQIASDYTIYKPLLRTLILSLSVAACTLVLMLPMAYYLAKKVKRSWQIRLLLLVMIPAWAGEIIRVFSYVLIFASNGVVNIFLTKLGLIDRPIPFLYTWFSLSMGLLYVCGLFMLIPLYAAMEKVPDHVLEAAADLGANPWQRFTRITLPLIRDGIATGVTLVFLIATGIYTVPLILAGTGTNLFSQVISSYFYHSDLTWQMGAAAAITLFVLALAIAGLLNWSLKPKATGKATAK